MNNGALQIVNGDFLAGEPSQMHVEQVLLARPGDYSQHPFLGVAVEDYMNAPLTPNVLQTLERQIKLQLEADGAKRVKARVKSITDIQIEATYES